METKERAIEKIISLLNTTETVIYSDASEKKGHFGAAVITLDRQGKIQRSSQATIGTQKNVLY
jgi:hypothetical protein